ncbi:Uncharacterised protein [uncultured archaeon]|nr:Uncharacterised protein [uncultured archaeon]
MNFYFFCKKKRINISVKRVSELGKVSGLMFRGKNTENLLFSFDKPTNIAIHSWFVFFPFLVVWLDSNQKIIEYGVVKPFTGVVRPSKPFKNLVEIPLNLRNRRVVKTIVGKKA